MPATLCHAAGGGDVAALLLPPCTAFRSKLSSTYTAWQELVHKGCSEMKGRSEKALKELADIGTVFDSNGCVACQGKPAAATGAEEALTSA